MNIVRTVVPLRRSFLRRWWWTALVAPPLAAALLVAWHLRLPAEAALLERHLIRAESGWWRAQVRLDSGWLLPPVARVVAWAADAPVEARLALAAVRRAGVGVYRRAARSLPDAAAVARADAALARRGWTRLLRVQGAGSVVLVYCRDGAAAGRTVPVCVAVFDGEEAVLASARLDSAALGELVARVPWGEVPGRIRLGGPAAS